MYVTLIVIHTIVSIMLIAVVLLQSGRSGGLTELFGGAAENIFGAKTNMFMQRATSFLAVFFIISCLLLAYISGQRSRSLIEQIPAGYSDEQDKQEKPGLMQEDVSVPEADAEPPDNGQ